MAICPLACADIDLNSLPNTTSCEGDPRRKMGIYKLAIFLCSTSLPSSMTCANLEALVESKAVVFTSPLSDVNFGEPEFADVKYNDCDPAVQKMVGRELTFNDRYKITIPEIPGQGENPATPANPFADYDFWGNKQSLRLQLRFGIVYCDGRIEFPKDDDGLPMSASFNIYRTSERVTEGNEESIYELKSGTIRFKGDPLQFRKPDLIVSGSDCADLAAAIGLSV